MRHNVFSLVSRRGLEWLECRPLARSGRFLHAFTTRREPGTGAEGGNFSLATSSGAESRPFESRQKRLARALGADDFQPVLLKQVHSSAIYRVEKSNRGGRPRYTPAGAEGPVRIAKWPAGDALITDNPGLLLEIRAADCLPLLLADPRRGVVAAVHAGWRGALARIIEKTVGELRRSFATMPADLIAVLGPSIRACCYEVGEEVIAAFHGRFVNSDKYFTEPPADKSGDERARRYPLLFLDKAPPGHGAGPTAHLDLVAVATDQLESAGVDPLRIFVADFCTACRTDLCFSYRKEGRATGRMAAVVGIRPR